MQSNAKSIRLVQDIQDLLAVRLPATNTGLNSIRQAFDANNWPYIVLSHGGNEAAGQPVVLIRISNVDAVSKDIFGNQTYAYAPHILELAYELQATPNIGDTFVSHSDLAACRFEAIKSGVRFQEKELANGTAVTAANVTADTTPTADLDQLYWPTKLV
jgi:hypothetical protein